MIFGIYLLKLILFDQNKQVLRTYEKKFESNLATNLTLSLGPKISSSKLMKTLATKFFNKQTDPDVKLLFVSAIRSCGIVKSHKRHFCCYFLQFFFRIQIGGMSMLWFSNWNELLGECCQCRTLYFDQRTKQSCKIQ